MEPPLNGGFTPSSMVTLAKLIQPQWSRRTVAALGQLAACQGGHLGAAMEPAVRRQEHLERHNPYANRECGRNGACLSEGASTRLLPADEDREHVAAMEPAIGQREHYLGDEKRIRTGIAAMETAVR
jgi:hypothetical protein